MKATKILHPFNCLTAIAVLLMLLATSALAANRWWDGTNNADPGDGIGQGGSGGGGSSWGSTNLVWDQGAGLSHTNWVNVANDTAIFEGTPGTVTVTHGNGAQFAALLFHTNYTLETMAGTRRSLLCGNASVTVYINVVSNATATIDAYITNGPSANRTIRVGGRGTLALNASNMFSGPIIIGNNTPAGTTYTASFANGNSSGQAPTVQASIIADLGVASSLGQQTTEANGTIQIGDASTGGTLEYTGTTAASTDRKVAIGSSNNGSGTASIRNNNVDPNHTLTFSNPAFNVPATVVTLTRTLQLSGSNTGNNTIAGQITNNSSGLVNVTKSGSGVWVLGGSNLYSGVTTVSGGVLKLDHPNAIPGGIGAAGGTSGLTLAGGVVGLTANSGNFTRTNGTGADQVQWTASGGFAAYGGTRTVKLSASSQNWGNSGLLGNGRALILGAATADGTLDWQQAISLAAQARTVQVDDGSADVDAIMSGNIAGGSSGTANEFIKTGAGKLALTSNNNSYWGPTTISNGTLQVGNGGTAGILSANCATITVATNATLAVNRSDAVSQDVGGGLGDGTAVISGEGGFSQDGSGTTTLTLANTYTGNTTVNAGTLAIQVASIATNSTVSVATGAQLNLGFTGTNLVGALVLNGITQPGGVYSSNTSPAFITGPGSLQVATTGPSGPATLTNSVSGSTLTFTWPSGESWRLVGQTNNSSAGLNPDPNAWFTVPGGIDGSNSMAIDPANPSVFYRLVYP